VPASEAMAGIVDIVAGVARGRLITIEGLDGAGKTTQARRLAEELESRRIPVRLLREPGGVEVSERIRSLVQDPALVVTPRAEALLYAAARAQLVEELLEPLLAAGNWVILDRFVDSSLAYQGAGRDLGLADVAAINRFATGALAPDRTILLDVDPDVGRARQADRGQAPDRLEREAEAFFAAVAEGYRELAVAEPDRFRVVDGGGDTDEVAAQVVAAIADLL
jgi:dTMP kinase